MNYRSEKNSSNYKVDNAIIMAAGFSSRFAPISYEYPKALLNVKGEVLIERQIKQLLEVGINDITIVVGYKKELFYYIKDKYNVSIVENPDYKVRNNNSTIYHVKDRLSNTYICSADNYFLDNVFEPYVENAYYSAVYQKGHTNEWCINTDRKGLITGVSIGGFNSWVMLGHAFFTKEFSKKFVEILDKIYHEEETKPLLWESIYTKHINQLPMYIRKYPENMICEFDTLDELRIFDNTYCDNTGSKILKQICEELNCAEREIVDSKPINIEGNTIGFKFMVNDLMYKYLYDEKKILN